MKKMENSYLDFVLRHWQPGRFDVEQAIGRFRNTLSGPDPLVSATPTGAEGRTPVAQTETESHPSVIPTGTDSRPGKTRRVAWRTLVAWALPLAAAVVLGVFLFQRWTGATTEYRAYDVVQAFTLPDGTRATLAPGATLTVQPHKDPRRVAMTGQVHFEVTHDEARPFRIQAPAATVRVLGTVFQVTETPEQTRVDVTEGKVLFARNDDGLMLTAGQSAVLTAGEDVPVRIEPEHPNPTAWATGRFVYDAAPLSEVLSELSDYYGVSLSLAAPKAGARPGTGPTAVRRLTGTFATDSLDEILDAVSLALDVEIRRTPTGSHP